SARISGRIEPAPGEGYPPIRVEQAEAYRFAIGSAQPDGQFIVGYRPGLPLSIWATTGKKKSPIQHWDVAPEEGLNDIVLPLSLSLSGSLRGTVRNQNGGAPQSPEGIYINLTPEDKTCPCDEQASPKADGSFTMEDLVPGSYTLSLFCFNAGTTLVGGPL